MLVFFFFWLERFSHVFCVAVPPYFVVFERHIFFNHSDPFFFFEIVSILSLGFECYFFHLTHHLNSLGCRIWREGLIICFWFLVWIICMCTRQTRLCARCNKVSVCPLFSFFLVFSSILVWILSCEIASFTVKVSDLWYRKEISCLSH